MSQPTFGIADRRDDPDGSVDIVDAAYGATGTVQVAGEYGAFYDGTECPVGRASASTLTCWPGRSEAGCESVASVAPFGARRGSDWQGAPSAADLTAIGNSTPDGFTGHEMLDGVGLIHMRGRVYDPAVGRFLSVDPLVRDAGASQSWNGYGYVEGRMLSARDPSGWSPEKMEEIVVSMTRDGGPGLRSNVSIARGSRINQPRAYQYRTPGAGGSATNPPGAIPPPAPIDPDAIVEEIVTEASRGEESWLDVLATPYGGWESFKYAVVCTVTCQWPGDGSFDSILVGLPPILTTAKSVIQFGRTAEQTAHAFRHIHGIVDTTNAMNAIARDLRGAEAALNQGRNIRNVVVDGVGITYIAFRFEDGAINVGRITLAKP